MNIFRNKNKGFTLLEILVVIAIIGILTSIITVNFSKARQATRDDVRMTSLKELQLALELYKSQYGVYPAKGCGVTEPFVGPGPQVPGQAGQCDADYIVGLAPNFIKELPTDPNQENDYNKGYLYITNSNRDAYKVMVSRSVEVKFIGGFNEEFARCPRDTAPSGNCNGSVDADIYAVYSAGAEDW